MTGKYRLRGAYLLSTHGTAVVSVLLLVAVLAAGAAGVIHVRGDDARTVTEREHVRTVGLAVNDSALVEGETPLWSEGTRLRDKPVYLLGPTPTLTLAARTSVPADREVRVEHRVVLVVEATVDGERLWVDRRTLDARARNVSDGELRTRTTIDVPALADRLAGLRNEIAAPVTLSSRVRVHTRYDTGRYAGTLSSTAPLSVGDETYTVGTFEPAGRTHAQQTTRVERSGSPLSTETVLSGAVALLALGGALGARVGARRLDDPARLVTRLERARLAEWISEGEIPEDAGKTTVTVSSLTDLVDVAIDSDRRVIHDEQRELYAVLDGDTIYEYRYSLVSKGLFEEPDAE